MRNAKTRLLSLVLAVIMVVSMLPATVLAEDSVVLEENESSPQPLTEDGGSTSAVTFTDSTGTVTPFYVDETLGADDTANRIYTTMHAAMEAVFAKWAETGNGTVTLGQDYTTVDAIDAMAAAANELQFIAVAGGQRLTINLNGHTITQNSGRLFGISGDNADTYLEVKNGVLVVPSSSAGGVLRLAGTTTAGIIKFVDCTIDHTGGGNNAFTPVGSANCHLYLDNVTFTSPKAPFVATTESNMINIYLQGGTKMYVNVNYIVRLRKTATLHLIDAEIYTTGDPAAVSSDYKYYYGLFYRSASTYMTTYTLERTDTQKSVYTASTETVYDYDNDGTNDLYKHTIALKSIYAVNVAAAEGGTIIPSVTQACEGDPVTLTVAPDTGFELAALLVDGVDVKNEVESFAYSFTMPAEDVTVSATFTAVAEGTFTINLTPPVNGSVEVATSAQEEEEVSITCTPDDGYELGDIIVTDSNNEVVDMESENSFVITDDVTVTVTFNLITTPAVSYIDNEGNETIINTAKYENTDLNAYTTGYDAFKAARTLWLAAGNGTIKLYRDIDVTHSFARLFDIGDGVSLTIDLNKHELKHSPTGEWRLVRLSSTNKDNPGSLVVKDGTITDNGLATGSLLLCNSETFVGTAQFINCHVINNGTYYPFAVGGTEDLHVHFIGGEYHNVYIVGSSSQKGNVYLEDNVKFYRDRDLIAQLSQGKLHLIEAEIYTTGASTTFADGYGILNPEDTDTNKGVFVWGTEAQPSTITKSATAEYDYNGTMLYKHTVTPAAGTYFVDVADTENGTVNDLGYVAPGSTVALTITPDAGYEIASVVVTDADGSDVTVENNSFTMPEKDVTVTVTFQLQANRYYITVANYTNGTVAISGNGDNVLAGETVTLTAVPKDEGYKVGTITVVGASGTPVTLTDNTFVMPEEDVTITVPFELILSEEPVVAYINGDETTNYYTALHESNTLHAYTSVEDAFDAAYDQYVSEGGGVDAATTPELHLYADLEVTKVYGDNTTGAVGAVEGGELLIDAHDHTIGMGEDVNLGFIGIHNTNFDVTVQNAVVEWDQGSRYFVMCGKSSDAEREGALTLKNLTFSGVLSPMNYICKYDVIVDGGSYTLGRNGDKAFVNAIQTTATDFKATITLTGGVEIRTTNAERVFALPTNGELNVVNAVIYTNAENLITAGTLTGTAPERTASDVDGYTYKFTGVAAEAPTTYTVTVNAATNGTVTATPEGVVEANTEVTVTVAADEGYKLSALTVNGTPVEVTDGTYTFTVEADATIAAEFVAIPVAVLKAFTLGVEDEILLNFKLTIPDEVINDDNSYVKMTRACDIAGVDKYVIMTAEELRPTKDASGRYVPTIGMAGALMTYDVTLEIFDGNGEAILITDGTSYGDGSTKAYVTRAVQDYYKDQLGRSGAAYDRVKSLIVAMTTYGGYAQQLFGYEANNPVYNILPTYGKEVIDLSGITADDMPQRYTVSGNTGIGAAYVSQQPALNAALSMKVNFTLAQPAENYTITYTHHEKGTSGFELITTEIVPTYDSSKDRYYVNLDKIEAAYWDYMYEIVITEKATGESYTISTSVMAYCGEKFASLAAYQNLFRAMYAYNQAARTYFGV